MTEILRILRHFQPAVDIISTGLRSLSTLLYTLDIGKATGYAAVHAERLAVPFTENLVATQHNHLKEIVE